MKVECQKKIVEKILENVLEYVQNAYGNFVVSEVLTRFSYDICAQIYSKLKTHFVQLSQFKFSSTYLLDAHTKQSDALVEPVFTVYFPSSQNSHRS